MTLVEVPYSRGDSLYVSPENVESARSDFGSERCKLRLASGEEYEVNLRAHELVEMLKESE